VTSPILSAAARALAPVLGLFSLYLLLRGADDPGGGFAGGVALAGAVALLVLAEGTDAGRRVLRVHPLRLLAAGLLCKLASGAFGIVAGKPFLTHQWMKLSLPGGLALELGTPLLFESGTYLVVLGAITAVVLSLAEA
jgi:multicomponent Na+:H+ antiporter subunit B